ncbi:MAG: spore coat protein [Bacillota bacterium]
MPHLNDRDILTDFLKDAKFKSTAYHMAALESASDSVRDTCVRLMSDELQTHKSIFDAMAVRGWYQVQPATHGAGAFPPGRFAPGPGNMPAPGAFQDPGYAGDYRRQPGNFPGVEGTPYTPGFERVPEHQRPMDHRRFPEGR